jgi:ubiquinone biosynthesis protein COQ4
MELHSHRNQIQYLETLRGLMAMVRDPGHTESVFDIEDGLQNLEAYQLAVEYVRRDPDMAELIEERFLRHGVHDLDALLRLPEESLGYCFARHMRDKGFDPDYFRVREVNTDLDYVLMRLRQTHDIWHIITGFDTDPVGELGLKAVELAQTRRPMAAMVASGGVLRTRNILARFWLPFRQAIKWESKPNCCSRKSGRTTGNVHLKGGGPC